MEFVCRVHVIDERRNPKSSFLAKIYGNVYRLYVSQSELVKSYSHIFQSYRLFSTNFPILSFS